MSRRMMSRSTGRSRGVCVEKNLKKAPEIEASTAMRFMRRGTGTRDCRRSSEEIKEFSGASRSALEVAGLPRLDS